MNTANALVCALCVVSPLYAADLSSYRGFAFGANVETVAKLAGVRPADTKTIHVLPRRIEQIDWYRMSLGGNPLRPDPVRGGILSFLDGKLYRMVIEYDRYRIEGMTAADMVSVISETYGIPDRPGTGIAVIARWQDKNYAFDLIRTGDQLSFALVLYAKQAMAAADTAIAEAARLELLDAPARAIREEKSRVAEEALAIGKMRTSNKTNFRP